VARLTGARTVLLSKRMVDEAGTPHARQLVSFYGFGDGELETVLHPPHGTGGWPPRHNVRHY
jgi:hypothetical protein